MMRSEPIAALDTDPRIEALIEQVALQGALLRALSDRLTRVEGLEPEPDQGSTTTIQRAAFMSGYSESGLRRLISVGRIKATKRGGRWLIDAASLSAKCAKAR